MVTDVATLAMKATGALGGNAHLNERDAHGNDGNAKDTVANGSEHLQLATDARLLEGKKTFCRHQIPETNLPATRKICQLKGVHRGKGYEAKVGRGDEVPPLPGVEHDRAQHDVDHDDHDAQGDRNNHLV